MNNNVRSLNPRLFHTPRVFVQDQSYQTVHAVNEKSTASLLRKPTPHRLNVLHLMRAKNYIHVTTETNCEVAETRTQAASSVISRIASHVESDAQTTANKKVRTLPLPHPNLTHIS